ncbi:Polygalacturonase inhibitor protein [Rhynchospora pubera]|uniref:Polygalacturonase inhibitor protein n=1 Tax=Rhynchospora pubera TaxID=906938 RepID=A0AAV8G1L2_9POAL|nr:Polygalacturonase inhibitor protein [Rhynchospora pubera]
MSIILLLLFLLCCNTTVLSTKNSDEIALLKIKKQLGDPPFLSSWVEGFNFCNIITPLGPNGFINVGCTNTSRVDGFVMRHLINFTAPFPEAICGLTELRILVIYQNPNLYGQIPSCINKLFNLNQVLISETSVSGRVPHFYNNTNLSLINLARNNLSYSLPPSLSTLPNLGNNQLHGDASFLFGTAGLIILANNSFKFDLSYIEFRDNLYEVDLSHNKIYGKVPASFATAVGLAYANLSFNRLCGELPQGGIMGRFSAAVFANNRCLCGYPLPPCSNSSPAPAPAPA